MKSIGLYPRVRTDTAGSAIASQAGAVGLIEAVRVAGLDRALSQALAPWRKPNARHDPGKILVDLALSLAVGGDCLADAAVLRDQPGVFGRLRRIRRPRLVDTLAADATKALAAIDTARAVTRAQVWSLAGRHAPNHAASIDDPTVVDLDATLLTAHSDKEQRRRRQARVRISPAAGLRRPRRRRHRRTAVVAARKGNAGSNTAADTADVWRPALDAAGQVRPEALVADASGLLDLSSRPKGMRVIVRTEKPNPGAQLRITDVNGWRVTASPPTPPPPGVRALHP